MAASDGEFRTAEERENPGWTDGQEHRRARKASEGAKSPNQRGGKEEQKGKNYCTVGSH